MSRRRFRVPALCVLGACCALAQPPQTAPGQPNTVIRLSTKEVVLDLIVRDKHGHLVSDLQPDEVKIYEDGVPQRVTFFRDIQGREQLEAEKTAARVEAASPDLTHPLNSLREVNFVSIVFAPMRLQNLAFAREAVQEFLKSEVLPNTYVTVYRLDARLRLVQPYTHDKPTLLAAVERATKGNSLLKSGTLASTILMNPNPGTVTTNTAGIAATSAPNANPLAQPAFDPRDPQLARNLAGLDASTGLTTALQTEAELETRLRFVDSLATGMTILDEMRELIHSQSRLPGRKIVLYLSDGLQLPPDRARTFDAVVSDANRSGVTFYTVDTRGLTGPQDNPINASVTQLNRAVTESQQGGALMQGQLSGGTAFDAGRATEDVQLLAVSNTQLALQALAVRTGGFAVANTNELAKPMERVMEDIRTHYELAYAPASEVYDGHFRKIAVKVDRPNVTVQTRSGYYALPDLNGEPLQSFEVTALKAMITRPTPHNVPYDTALMQFRPDQNAMQCEVAFEVPIAGLKIMPDQKTGKARLQASVVALIQDASGQVVGKVSRQFVRTVSNSDVAAIRGEKIEYAEPVDLAPGHYTLSTAVIDGEANAIGAMRLAAYVKPASQLGLSSLEVVKRITPLNGERNPLDPLETQNGRVTVTLDSNAPSGKPVDLYFIVYPDQRSESEPPKLLVELLNNGKEVARMNPELPKPDNTGAIPVVAELKPPVGEYDVRVTVRQGTAAAQSTLGLIIH